MTAGSQTAPAPLAGLRVIDLSRVLAGPLATMTLGDLGADVVKVERPGEGDDTRHWGPPFAGDDAAYFLSLNRNKRSVVIDLRSADGVAAVERLSAGADVLIENFRPGLRASSGSHSTTCGRRTRGWSPARSRHSARRRRRRPPGRATTSSCRHSAG